MNKLVAKIGKEQFVILIIAGIILLIIESSFWKKETDVKNQTKTKASAMKQENGDTETANINKNSDSYEKYLEEKLEGFISSMEGAGKTKVLLMTNGSVQKIVEKDSPYIRENDNTVKNDENTQNSRIEDNETTVFIEDSDGNKTPFISKEYAPKVVGVVVACKGGDNPELSQNIIELCQSLFDLDAHTIKVVKIKE